MGEYREIVLSGWGSSHSHQRSAHYWAWNGGREFTTACGAHLTTYRPREAAHLTHCKACERKRAAQKPARTIHSEQAHG